jgi:predicted small lipoprotein YifL
MKRLTIYFVLAAMLVSLTGCGKKHEFLPDARNDYTYRTVGEMTVPTTDWVAYPGNGYHISTPPSGFYYETDFDDGAFEESWDVIADDDACVKVTMYQNMDETDARGMFLREHEEYMFEDLGETQYGSEHDGDSLCFRVYPTENSVYILSWEYTSRTSDDTIAILNTIANSFALTK